VLSEPDPDNNKPNYKAWWSWWCYPTSSGHGGTPRRPNSQATTQGLDQRSKMKEVPNMARRRGSDAGQFKRQWVKSCR